VLARSAGTSFRSFYDRKLLSLYPVAGTTRVQYFSLLASPFSLDRVVILGGGPAGCAAGRLLAAWGHRVLIVERPRGDRRALAESIPPSADKVLAALGLLTAVQDARFHPWRGNRVWWGAEDPRIETFPAGVAGYQVDRARFDPLLRDLAMASGAEIRQALVRGVEHAVPVESDADPDRPATVVIDTDGSTDRVEAAFVLDCSGRAGVIARTGPRRVAPHRTIALSGVWRARDWPGCDTTHTLVTSYADGWAWSVATGPFERHVTVMVDPLRSDLERGASSRDVYLAEVAKAGPLTAALRPAVLADGPWGADASVYDAHRYAGPRFLLVGDAASFIDPLSSFGVKKALSSGWLAAIVTHTVLGRPEMREEALTFFDRRERVLFAASRAQSAQFAADAAADAPRPFWLARADASSDPYGWNEIDPAALAADPQVRAAFADLKQRVTISLREDPSVRLVRRPMVRDREVVLDDHLMLPEAPGGIRYLRSVDLIALRRLASSHHDVGDLCEAIERAQPGVALPDILGALSFLIARGVLRHPA
jgi:flavin-dependent dehydrogenase